MALRRAALPVSRWAKDEDLVALSQTGISDASEMLLARYRPMVENKARAYFVQGAEAEDVVQEGMIGLANAMRDYRRGFRAHFRIFAEVCVSRQIISAVIMAARNKHRLLTESDSLYQSLSDEEGMLLQEILTNPLELSPFDLCWKQMDLRRRLTEAKKRLSQMECRVCHAFLQGKKYGEIGDELEIDMKSVDNALQRIRAKLSSIQFAD